MQDNDPSAINGAKLPSTLMQSRGRELLEPDLTENAHSVLAARYLIRDPEGQLIETPRQMFSRIAEAIAEAEAPEMKARVADAFFGRMARLEFLPNTPCLVNAGRPGGSNQYSACFVIPVPDTMEGVFEAIKSMALVHKTGGGTGFSFSRLRAAGSSVRSTSGVASGPISFMRPFNAATDATKQGGVRRGANMGILRVDHPDILDFVRIKSNDLREMENFNLSVAITDEFMAALDADREYALRRPETGSTVRMIRAREVWGEIIRCAHKVGDPGLFFLDRANAHDPLVEALGPIEATNPCVPGETRILTRHGWKSIASVVDQCVDVWNGEEWSSVVPAITGKDRPIVRVTLSDGHSLRCTPRHVFHLADGTAIDARDLVPGDALEKLGITPPTEGSETLPDGITAYLHGFYQGDGYWNSEKRQHEINFYGDAKIAIAEQLERRGFIRLQPRSESQDRRRGVIIDRDTPIPAKGVVPDLDVFGALFWLAGLLDSDGNVAGNGVSNYGYQISSVDRGFLAEVQMLVRRLGVPSALGLMKDAERKVMPGGEYDCQRCWRLSIASSSARQLQNMGLKTLRLPHDDNNPARSALRFPIVISVEPDGIAPLVYCFTESKRHRGVFEGILTGQCGEVPLRDLDACSLGSINVSKFVSDDRAGMMSFDISALQACVRDAVRFLDDMVSLSEYPIPRIREVVDQSRKIGLGVMGWADALARLGIPYASPRARILGGDLMHAISSEAIRASEALAVERGTFGAWSSSKWAKESRTPRRNATCTVIAPTGSISIIAGCSSGIEPLYALSITRNQAGLVMAEVHPAVEREGRRHGWWNAEVAAHVRATGSLAGAVAVPEDWRRVFAIANEISVPDHVLMQSAFQAHVEDAVSKTINLRNDAKPEDIEAAYRLAWDTGCKGITVYRDGCRDKQVLTAGVSASSSEPAAVLAQTPQPGFADAAEPAAVQASRPGVTDAAQHRRKIPKDGRRHGVTMSVTTPFGTAHVTINEHPDDGDPFEVFVRIGKSGSEVMAWTEAFGRATSYLLSMPGPIPPRDRLAEIAQQMADIGGGSQVGIGPDAVVSAPDGIARILRKYLRQKDPEPELASHDQVATGATLAPARRRSPTLDPKSAVRFDLCPSCGRATLSREQRCGICSTCGFSRC